MNEYVIMTDTGCDIKPEMLNTWGVEYKNLTFKFTDSETEYANNDMEITEFYNHMRSGRIAKTAAVNTESFKELFEEKLAAGIDVLYIGFSSGLSNTYNAARIAANELSEKYPERKIFTVDSLGASAGEGLLVYIAVKNKAAGMNIEDNAKFVEDSKLKISIWFTVDDLVYLKRGGRISPTTAFVGNMLGIKPVLHMDEAGHLVNVTKVRGRKSAIMALADKYTELATDKKDNIIFISHADCENDAKMLASLIEEKHGAKTEVITDVGTVIGAHAGPGTLALFFMGNAR